MYTWTGLVSQPKTTTTTRYRMYTVVRAAISFWPPANARKSSWMFVKQNMYREREESDYFWVPDVGNRWMRSVGEYVV